MNGHKNKAKGLGIIFFINPMYWIEQNIKLLPVRYLNIELGMYLNECMKLFATIIRNCRLFTSIQVITYTPL